MSFSSIIMCQCSVLSMCQCLTPAHVFFCLDSVTANLKTFVFSTRHQLIRSCGLILSGHIWHQD